MVEVVKYVDSGQVGTAVLGLASVPPLEAGSLGALATLEQIRGFGQP